MTFDHSELFHTYNPNEKCVAGIFVCELIVRAIEELVSHAAGKEMLNKLVTGERGIGKCAASASSESSLVAASVREQRRSVCAFREIVAVSVFVTDVKVCCDPAA